MSNILGMNTLLAMNKSIVKPQQKNVQKNHLTIETMVRESATTMSVQNTKCQNTTKTKHKIRI